MGRLADFMAKDLKRKRLAMNANGWRAPPGMAPPQPAQLPAQPGFPQMSQQVPQMPDFSGMLPHAGEAKLPMGFEEFQRRRRHRRAIGSRRRMGRDPQRV